MKDKEKESGMCRMNFFFRMYKWKFSVKEGGLVWISFESRLVIKGC